MERDIVVIGGEGAVGETLAGGSAGVVFLDEDEHAVERAAEADADAGIEPISAATALAGALDRQRRGREGIEERDESEPEANHEKGRLRSDSDGGVV